MSYKHLPHEEQIVEYEEAVRILQERSDKEGLLNQKEKAALNKKVEELKCRVYSSLTSWDRVVISRHPDRPHSMNYINNIFDDFIELKGDRLYGDDPAIVTGIAKLGKQSYVVIGQEKGKTTDSRMYRNFGMSNPEGYRKALRMVNMASKFNIPVVSFLDTPGAYPGLGAEERGQGWAIAQNLRDWFSVEVPIIILVIGEGCSGGALGVGIGDNIGMLEHAYYSVISPEGCASILWKDASKRDLAAERLKLNAEDLMELGIIDEIIPEPVGGAHKDHELIFNNLKDYIKKNYRELAKLTKEELLDRRYKKFRKMGKFEEV